MKQYLELLHRIQTEGEWVYNPRTNSKALTVINTDLEYNCSDRILPILTTKKVAWKAAIAEILGYIKGFDNAAQFRELGTKTWDANANADTWQENPYCKGKDDLGACYGVQGRRWGGSIDQVKKVYNDLRNGIDDRGEIITYWNVSDLHKACLRPCLYSYTFSLLGDTLHLTAYQRSADVALGLPFNMIQMAWLLQVMAQITNKKAGTVYHKIVNAHLYKNQLEGINKQISREPYPNIAQLLINPNIKTLVDVENSTLADYDVLDYFHQGVIKFPFTI